MTSLCHAQALLVERDLPAALAAFDRAELEGAEADTCAAGRWQVHMLAGNFTAAWQQSDAIRRRATPDVHRFWEGDDLRGKRVTLRCLHGFGDAVQFLRYAPKLQALASELIVEVPPAMVEVARYFEGVGKVICWGPDAPTPPPAWDVQVEIMELAYVFRTSMSELPLATRYLRLPAALEHQAARLMGKRRVRRIGVVWSGGDWNSERFLPISTMRTLFETSGFEFWSLQGGHARDEWRAFPFAAQVHDAAVCGEGILALTAAILQLDLVITIDTLAAHLAGAVGKPVWILLPHAADWRWMTGRDDSPWYPTAKLFRQTSPGDWEGVMAAVRRQLVQTWGTGCG